MEKFSIENILRFSQYIEVMSWKLCSYIDIGNKYWERRYSYLYNFWLYVGRESDEETLQSAARAINKKLMLIPSREMLIIRLAEIYINTSIKTFICKFANVAILPWNFEVHLERTFFTILSSQPVSLPQFRILKKILS